MAQITYADKVAINENPNVADINKVKADDMNEIKSVVNGIITSFIDKTYPVGSIYMSINNTSPATLFGGTWERIEGRFICGTGTPTQNSYSGFGTIGDQFLDPTQFGLSLGLTGGEYFHTLTINEMPSHNHNVGIAVNVSTGNSYGLDSTSSTYLQTKNTGGGQQHNNLPPFIAVNIWKRTA